jgi:PAS domain S-box-containing protein
MRNDTTVKADQQLRVLRTRVDDQTVVSAEPAKNAVLAAYKLLYELRVHQKEPEMQSQEVNQAHVALETLCAHYLELYDFAPVGYITLTEEGMIAECNLFTEKLLGKERKNLINQAFEQLIADEYKDLWYRHFLYAKQNSLTTQGCELPFRQENGTISYFHLDCLYLKPDNTPPVMHVTFTDVSLRKQTEEELRAQAIAFETQAGIIVTDAQKIILRVNKAFTRITGYNAEEVMGQKPDFLRSGLHDENFYKTLWTDVDAHGFWQGEIWDKHKNGEIFPVWQTISSVIGTDGAITHYIGAITDFTVHKQAENVLLDDVQHLENQVTTIKEELENTRVETEQINTALNVLLKHRETDKTVTQIAFADEIETTLLPLIKKMKTANAGRLQTIRLTNILETNLQQLVKSYGHAVNLASAYKKLTAMERQVASMIRQGISSKVIAAALNVSTATISVHRKHIRKKLEIDSATNLYSHLQSLIE